LDERQLAYLTEVGHRDHEALLAIDPRTGSCAGVARFVRVGADVAEPAIVVADHWQRLGLGTALLEQLAARVREEGVTRFSAVLLAGNRDAIGLFENLGERGASRRAASCGSTSGCPAPGCASCCARRPPRY
jgi:GNAT superfamily N-acetyltransferase